MLKLLPPIFSLSLVLACSGATEPQAIPSAPAQTAPTPPDPSPGDTPPPPPPRTCAPPLAKISCNDEKPAPANEKDVYAFLREAAVPLRCGEGDDLAWDVRPLVDLYGDQKMFMLGEVHGSNEIGVFSAIMLKALAQRGLVTVVASELPMDYQSSLQAYADGKDDPIAQQLLDGMEPNTFAVTLTRAARELNKAGAGLRVGAVDIPVSPESAAAWLEYVANGLTTQKSVVLDALPKTFSWPRPTAEERGKVETFFKLIEDKKKDICAELSPTDCERLEILTLALWTSANQSERDIGELWFERREQVIYFNLRMLMRTAVDRMYLHMGAAHTDKNSFSAGARMAKEHPLTRGSVFSVAPAWGNGSVIFYGEDMPLPADPTLIAAALTNEPEHPLFVSTTRPNAACQANPLGNENAELSLGARRESYDGYVHYGRLTSEVRPKESRFASETPVLGESNKQTEGARRLRAFRANVLEKERSVLAARRVQRRIP